MWIPRWSRGQRGGRGPSRKFNMRQRTKTQQITMPSPPSGQRIALLNDEQDEEMTQYFRFTETWKVFCLYLGLFETTGVLWRPKFMPEKLRWGSHDRDEVASSQTHRT